MTGVRSSKRSAGAASSSRRRWIFLVFAVLAIAALFCAGVHVVVSTRLLRKWVNTDPDALLLDYDAASSWIPGEIRIRGLRMRGSDPNVQWFFRIEKATISVSLLDLLHKQFHATRVRAEGLEFRLREKQKKSELSAAHAARLPSIPGFSDPPLTSPAKETPPLSESEKRRFWTVRVENFLADPAPDIWIEIYRFRGRARVTGGFTLRPHVRVAIGPAAVEFLSGDLLLAPSEPMLSAASGRGDCVIDPYAPEEVRAKQIWRRISGTIRLQGRITDLRCLNHYLGPAPEPRFSGGGRNRTLCRSIRPRHRPGRGRLPGRAGHRALQGRNARGPRVRPVRHPPLGRRKGRHGDLGKPRRDGEHHDNGDEAQRARLVGPLRHRLGAPPRRPLGAHVRGLPRRAADLHARGRETARVGGGDPQARWDEGLGRRAARERPARRFRPRRHGRQVPHRRPLSPEEQDRRGAFLVETGLLAVGVAIEGPSSHVKLLGARKWFQEQAK